MINHKVGLIGGGNMARAIVGGLLRGGMHATDVLISEPRPEQCEMLRQELYGAMVTEDNGIVAAQAETLVFAVKPQILKDVCSELQARASMTSTRGSAAACVSSGSCQTSQH
jgi:pyrroline-5-carboxylate reductase